MTVKQLKDYILQHMTAEEALEKLLSSSLLTYEKLKFPEEGKEVHPLIIMSMAALDMNWGFLINKDDENVNGLLTGTPEYINLWLSKNEK